MFKMAMAARVSKVLADAEKVPQFGPKPHRAVGKRKSNASAKR